MEAELFFRLAIGKIRTVSQLDRHAVCVGIHSRPIGSKVSSGPFFGRALLDPLNQGKTLRLQCQPCVEHPDFQDPLFMIDRPLVFDFLALFQRSNIILPDHDHVGTFLIAPAQAHQQQRDDTAEHDRFLHS